MPHSSDLADLKRLLDQGVQLVDVLPPDEYAHEHLPGAINIPLATLDAKSVAQLDRARPVAVYCHDALWDISPRAAWRLETLGFEQVHDYVGGKADWLASGLPREGAAATVPYAGDLVDRAPPTCRLATPVADVRAALDDSGLGFCLVVNELRVVLGRVRRSAIQDADASATAETVMEPGPRTVRFNVLAADLVRRLAARDLGTAIVTTPAGSLVGVFRRVDAERYLHPPAGV